MIWSSRLWRTYRFNDKKSKIGGRGRAIDQEGRAAETERSSNENDGTFVVKVGLQYLANNGVGGYVPRSGQAFTKCVK